MTTAVELLTIESWPQTAEGFDRLIAATQDELAHFAYYRLGNRDDAEDVVQDVYVEAFRDRARRQHVTGVRPYLFRMVRNRIRMCYGRGRGACVQARTRPAPGTRCSPWR